MLNRFTLELLAFRELLAIADLRVLEEQNSGVVMDSALVERLPLLQNDQLVVVGGCTGH